MNVEWDRGRAILRKGINGIFVAVHSYSITIIGILMQSLKPS
jgi:hypothetical protein